MKKIWLYLFFIVIGVIIGRAWDSTKAVITPTSTEERELVHWNNVGDQRSQEGIKITEKAKRILSNLSENGFGYRKNNLCVEGYGEFFSSTGLLIYYKKNLVFEVENADFPFSKDKVRTFHPGEWVNELQSIDIEKEKTIQKTQKLIKSYS